jgi:hypothetical protein
MSQEMVLEAALKCPVALQAAVEALGWTWLGHGIHTQYVRKTEGHGIAIPLDAVERNGVLTQTILDDGSIEIDVHVGGGATELGKEPPTLGGTSAPTL